MSVPQDTAGAGLSEVKTALLQRWRQGGTISADQPAIPRRAGAGPAPLSLAQQRLWFLEQFNPGTPAYNLFFGARVAAALAPEALAAGFDDLVRRHETLRTTFRLHDGAPLQFVDEGTPAALEVVDLRALGPQEGVAAALERLTTAISEPFALETGPLVRMLHYRLDGGDLLGLVVHHLVADGWSLGVALRELSTAYLARVAGREPALPALQVQYVDIAEWQRATVREGDWAEDLAYWRQRLADLPVLELPTDRRRPAVSTSRGDWRELRLPRALSDGLRALAREEDATLFMVMLAALQVVLCRLSGQRDLVVGAAIANRAQPETFGLVGNFINMLALRTDMGGGPTFQALLQRVRDTCLGAFAHQAVPFERLVEALQPERDLSRSVLFQVLFVLQPPTTDMTFAGLPLELIELGSQTVRADLELDLWDQPEVVGRLAFSTDLFDAATIERLIARLLRVLSAVVEDRQRAVLDLPLVLPEERELLEAWGSGEHSPVPPISVPELFEDAARRRPDALAVVAGGVRMSYGELNRRANRLARHLRSSGVGPEVLVAVCVERSAQMLVAVLGVLKAGGAYVPLDPRYPPDHLHLMVADAGARVAVTEEALTGRVSAPGVSVVCLDRDAEVLGAIPDDDLGVPADPEGLAYVIYTSGSTGEPKGVQIPHQALTNLVLTLRERPGIAPGDVMATVASLSFDASVAEIFPPLCAGAALVIATAEDVVDGERLADVLLANGVTALQATASQWRLLLAAGRLAGSGISARCGGEATPPDLADTLARAHEDAWNLYGPTETTVWSSASALEPGGPVSLGRPLANTTIRILDDDLRQVPIGVIGELCIGGAGLSRGYLGRPRLTAERFVPDPFAARPGSRLYRTGDLARYLPDGTLLFAGRRDHQVKLRGHRIEPGEIEAALSTHRLVAHSVVVLRVTEPDDARLVAYVVPPPGAGEKERTRLGPLLSRHLRDRLPDHMVPSAFVVLDALPRTPSGKLDRARLPVPDRRRPETDATYLAPRGPLEAQIAELTADFLELERVGVLDDFFALGGHSLLAARLVTELRQRYQVDLLLHELFVTPTVEHLAAAIGRELDRRQHFAGEDVRLRRIVDELPEEAVHALLADLLVQES